jgi:tetratricopeptide (TPR) repeat protein
MYMLKDIQEKQPDKAMKKLFILFTVLSFSLVAKSQSPDEYFLQGAADLVHGNFDQAVENLSMAITRNNSDDSYYLKRGEAYYKMGDYGKAIEDFNEANDIIPDIADLWLAKAFAGEHNFPKSITALKNHLSSTFRLPEDIIKKDSAFDVLQNTDDWFTLWQNDWYSAEEKTEADVNYYVKKGQFTEALDLADKSISGSPANPVLYALRARTNFVQANFAAAIADYSSALNIDKKNNDYLFARGSAYLKAQRYKDALTDFNKALKIQPDNFDYYLERASAYAGLNDYSNAVKDAQFYLKYFDSDQKAIYQCGEYYYGMEDYLNALKCFNKNLKEDPTSALYFKARGKTYLKTSTYKYAINDLSMSLDLNPNDGETYTFLGIAMLATGDKTSACSDFQKAKKLGNGEAVRYIIDNCQ